MIRAICILLLGFICLEGNAQGEIRGGLIDSLSKEKIELATVSLLYQKDSSLVAYTISGKDGRFQFQRVPSQVPLILQVSAIGYNPIQKLIFVKGREIVDLKELFFLRTTQQLGEVVVNAFKPPVLFKKDTLEFNASAYKVREDAVIEDLLKQLPGMRVDLNGNIFINGKQVSRILIDGKDFFSSDIKIASKNLSADLVDKIQVTDDQETNLGSSKRASQKLINVKLKKEAKKKILGKLYAGLGTEERSQVGGILNTFRDTLQVSLIGFSNNLNVSSFSFSDVQNLGGFGRSGFTSFTQQEGGGYNINGVSFGGINNGIQHISSLGVNVNNEFSKKVGANFQYFHTSQQTDVSTLRRRRQFINDTILETNSAFLRREKSVSNHLGTSLKWNPSKQTKIKMSLLGSFTDLKDNTNSETETQFKNAVINSGVIKLSDHSRVNSFSQLLTITHRFKNPKANFSLIQNFKYLPNQVDNTIDNRTQFFTNTLYFDSTLLRRNSDYSSTMADITMIYRFPIAEKISNGLKLFTSYHHFKNDVLTFSNIHKNTLDTLIDQQSILSNRTELTTRFTYESSFELSENTSFEISITPVYLRNANRLFISSANNRWDNYYLLPGVSLFGNNFSVEYYQNINQPSLQQLLPITLVYSPVSQFIGNSFLIPYKRHHIYSNYGVNIEKYKTEISFYGKFDWETNGLLQQVDINQEGAEQLSIQNGNQARNMAGSIEFAKRMKASKNHSFIFKVKSDISFSKSKILVNKISGDQSRNQISFEQSLNWRFKRTIDITGLFSWSNTQSQFTTGSVSDIKWLQQNAILKSSIALTPKYTLLLDYVYQRNTQLGNDFQSQANILNGSISRKLFKRNQGEVKLSVFDLFNQNINIQRRIERNIIEDIQSNVLRRYFLLSFIYQLKK